jgi:hypothetical protein
LRLVTPASFERSVAIDIDLEEGANPVAKPLFRLSPAVMDGLRMLPSLRLDPVEKTECEHVGLIGLVHSKDEWRPLDVSGPSCPK